MTEKQWMAKVVAAAEEMRWKTYHTYDSRKSEPGFPDLVLVRRDDRVIYAELKSQTGKLTPAQDIWRQYLLSAGAEYHIWRPSDWDAVIDTLAYRRHIQAKLPEV